MEIYLIIIILNIDTNVAITVLYFILFFSFIIYTTLSSLWLEIHDTVSVYQVHDFLYKTQLCFNSDMHEMQIFIIIWCK